MYNEVFLVLLTLFRTGSKTRIKFQREEPNAVFKFRTPWNGSQLHQSLLTYMLQIKYAYNLILGGIQSEYGLGHYTTLHPLEKCSICSPFI